MEKEKKKLKIKKNNEDEQVPKIDNKLPVK